jgi:hypothetical protein
MAKAKTAKQVRLVLGLIFALFLLVNGVFHTLAVMAGLGGETPLSLLPEDVSPAVRLILFVIGIGVSWLLARMLFKFLVNEEVLVGDSTNTAYILLFYLVLTFSMVSFVSVLGWFWLPVLFLVLLIYSVFTLWKLIGGLLTAGAVALTFIAMIGTWVLAS